MINFMIYIKHLFAFHTDFSRIFQPRISCAVFSSPVFSRPAFLCHIFQSRIFQPCSFVPYFPFLHFPDLHFSLCRIFMSRIFSRPYIRPMLYTPSHDWDNYSWWRLLCHVCLTDVLLSLNNNKNIWEINNFGFTVSEYTPSLEKRSHSVLGHNFDKFKHTFVIFLARIIPILQCMVLNIKHCKGILLKENANRCGCKIRYVSKFTVASRGPPRDGTALVNSPIGLLQV